MDHNFLHRYRLVSQDSATLYCKAISYLPEFEDIFAKEVSLLFFLLTCHSIRLTNALEYRFWKRMVELGPCSRLYLISSSGATAACSL